MIKNILLVEDEAIIALDISLELESNGYKVSSADNGIKAIEIAEKEDIDLAVLDIKGEMNGVDVFLKLKEMGIPAVFSTANIDILNKSEEEHNFNAKYIKKPFNAKELGELIEKLDL